MLRSLSALLSTSLLLTLASLPAASLTLNFGEFGHGDIVNSSNGVLIDAENFGESFDLAVAFLTTETGTADPDLEIGSGWSMGNLPSDEPLGNILIIQENDTGCASGVGTCSNPDDEGSRPAGELEFILPAIFTGFSFDLVDVEASGEDGTVSFYLGDSLAPEVAFSFSEFESWGQGVEFGDNSANRIDFTGRFDGAFDRVVVTMRGSGGVDNLTFVPEPGAGALLGFGLAGLSHRARRNRARRHS